MKTFPLTACWLIGLTALCSVPGCSRSSGPSTGGGVVIRVEGSDTMVNLAQAWAEAYHKSHPNVSVQVSGGGSGVGIASLIDGVTDIANSSRKMRDKEMKLAQQNLGFAPHEFIVGMDALAVYVHKDNPLETISIEELAEIYGDGGSITKWSQLGIKNEACNSDEITRVSRQNNSGTYHYFREAVLGEARDYKLGSIDQSGSKDVVALVSRTPCAIGYSGMGYKTSDVKWVKVSRKKGEPGVEPSVEAAKTGEYPIARPLYIYTRGEPTGPVKEYIDWILSDVGQKIVLDLGYVPVGPTTSDAEESTESAEEQADPAESTDAAASSEE